MKKGNSGEYFIGIFDFKNEERITGIGQYKWKDDYENIWECKGICFYYFLKYFIV